MPSGLNNGGGKETTSNQINVLLRVKNTPGVNYTQPADPVSWSLDQPHSCLLRLILIVANNPRSTIFIQATSSTFFLQYDKKLTTTSLPYSLRTF